LDHNVADFSSGTAEYSPLWIGAITGFLAFALIVCLAYPAAGQMADDPSSTGIENETSQITFVTSDDYPYQTPERTGATYEILMRVFSKINYSPDQIHFFPWARSYNLAVSGEGNIAIFSMTRKPARELLFDWCCYLFDGLTPRIIVRNNFTAGSSEDPLTGKKAVLWRGSASKLRFDKLVANGLEAEHYMVGSHKQLIQMLLHGRADFTISFPTLISEECRVHQLDCKPLVEIDYPQLRERNKLYLALGKNVDEKLRKKFVGAFEKIRESKKYSEILGKYNLTYVEE